jgi:hypothetical protein
MLSVEMINGHCKDDDEFFKGYKHSKDVYTVVVKMIMIFYSSEKHDMS